MIILPKVLPGYYMELQTPRKKLYVAAYVSANPEDLIEAVVYG